MEKKYMRRISSMLFLASAASEQSSSTASSYARQKSVKISRTPSPSTQLNLPRLDLPQPEPGSAQLHEQTEISDEQASQQESDGMSASMNGLGISPDTSQMSAPLENSLPADPSSPSGNVSEGRLESRPENGSESRAEHTSKGRSRSGTIRSSRVNSKGGVRPPTPSKLLLASNPPETRKSMRRSWLPGKSRIDLPIGNPDSTPQAWLFGSEDKTPYDASNLVTFQEVIRVFHIKNEHEYTDNVGARTMGYKGRHAHLPAFRSSWERPLLQAQVGFICIFQET